MLYKNLKSIGYNGGQYKAIMKGGNCLAGLSDAYSYIKITSNMECDVAIWEGFCGNDLMHRAYHFNEGDNYILAPEAIYNKTAYSLHIDYSGNGFPLFDFDFTNFKVRDYIDIIRSSGTWEMGEIICPDNISLGFGDVLFATDSKARDLRGKKIHYMNIPASMPYDITLGTIYYPSNYREKEMPTFGFLQINSIEGMDSSVTKIRMIDEHILKHNLTQIMNANQDNHAITIYVTEDAYNLVDDDLRTLAEEKNFTIEIY